MVADACRSTKELHNEIIGIANVMAVAEVGASAVERALILADGFDAMIDVAEKATLAAGPPELVAGLTERRASVVAETEPRLAADAAAPLIAAVEAEPACQNVIQLR